MLKYKLLLGVMALSTAVTTVNARQLTVDEAVAAAGIVSPLRQNAPSLRTTRTYTMSEGGLNTVYVVPSATGYYVLAADDVAPAILGYSEDGTFDPDNMPDNMRAWLADYSSHIRTAAERGINVVAAPADPSLGDIAPMLTTKWNQGYPYYNDCPLDNGERTYTGCVATAAAQVLNTYKYPTTGIGTYSYTWNDTTLTFDYANTTFQWDKMADTYSGASPADECAAVAELMYAIGVSCNMTYGTGGSGTYGQYLAVGLMRNFGYDKSMHYATRDYYSLAQWSRMLHEQLSSGNPLYYDGSNESAGHAFVIDGYSSSDGFFHVNWGWGGISDGYFSIITLDPSAQGIGGSTEGYFLGQSALLGLKPAEEGSELYVEFVADLADVDTTSCAYGEYLQVGDDNTAFYNTSLGTVTTRFGLEWKPTDGVSESLYTYYEEDLDIPYGSGYLYYYVPTDTIPVGTYDAYPVALCNGRPYRMLTGMDDLHFTAEVTSEKVTLLPNAVAAADLECVSLEALTPFFRSKKCVVQGTIKSNNAEYYNFVYAKFTNPKGKVTSLGSAVVDIPEGCSETITVTGTVPFATTVGTGYIQLYDGNNNPIGEPVAVAVDKVPSGTPDPTLSDVVFVGASGSGTEASPYLVAASDIEITATLSIGGGYYTDDILAMIADTDDGNYIAYIYADFVCCWGTETQALTFASDLSETLEDGHVYKVVFYYASGSSYVRTSDSSETWFKIGSSGITDVSHADYAVFPTPAEAAVTVTAPTEITQVQAFDLAGALRLTVVAPSNDGRIQLEAGTLAAGNYLLRVTTSDGTVKTLRLLKK